MCDHGAPSVEIDADSRGRAVMLIVAKHEFSPAPLYRVPVAGVEHGLQFIEAGRRSGPVAVAIPGKPASAVQSHAEPVQGSEHNQADSQTGDGREEHEAHDRPAHRAVHAFHWPPSSGCAHHPGDSPHVRLTAF